MTVVDFASINIPTSVGKDAWQVCFLRTIERGEIFGINEAFAPAAKALYLKLAEERSYGQYGLMQGGNPIFWDQLQYRKVAGRVVRLHGKGPLYRSWPGYNDARYVTVVVLRPVGMGKDGSQDIVVINGHLVPEGSKVPEEWRQKVRARSFRKLARAVRRSTKKGLVCVVMGDMNVFEPFELGENFRWVRGRGIDKIGFSVPEGMTHGTSVPGEYDAPTDHRHGVVATLRWHALGSRNAR